MTWFVHILLRLYPASFRAEYAHEMEAVFARRRRDVSSGLGILALWMEFAADTLANALRVHFDILWQDLQHASRTLANSPGFALTVIGVTAIGIGANTAVFSLTDHVLLKPLPFAGQDRLVKVWEDLTPSGYREMEPSPANYRDWKRMSTSFEGMGAYQTISVNLVGQGEAERLDGAAVTADLLPLLGVPAAVGRTFTAGDDRTGAAGTVLLSDGLWTRRFGRDPSVLGRTVLLDNQRYLIVGVMPASFYFPNVQTAFWTPMRFAADAFEDRTNNDLTVISRLRPGVSRQQAQSEMRIVASQLEQTYPKENQRVGVAVNDFRDDVSQRARLLLMALLGAALCVLLIACTNLANLLLVRAMGRRQEFAIRAALGAGRERLVRQLLTESLLLSACGGVLGVALGALGLPLLAKLVPTSLPIAETPSLDWRVMVFALALTCLTGVGFGVIPALRVGRSTDAAGLREGSRSGVGGRRERLRSALVVVEVTLSFVLLVSSGLLIRALWKLDATNPGFRSDGVLTLETALAMPKYEKTALREQFYTRVLTEVRSTPGVADAAYISFLPIDHPGGIWPVNVEGYPQQDETNLRQVSLRFVTPGFFSTLGIPLLMGRDVGESDTITAPFSAVVSESFVRKYWPKENPLGRRFQFAFATRTVVGVVGDIRVRGLERTSEPQVYLPYKQVPDAALTYYVPKNLVIRTSLDSGKILPVARRAIQDADSDQPISNVRMLSDVVASDTAPRLVQVRVLGAFAVIAFVLAGIGIHGLLSFAVSSRKQEIGVRIALGATPGNILRLVFHEGVVLAMCGVAAGVVLAYASGRAIQSLLAGVAPDDVPTFLAAMTLSLAMAGIGAILPALRAVRVDPTTAIRGE